LQRGTHSPDIACTDGLRHALTVTPSTYDLSFVSYRSCNASQHELGVVERERGSIGAAVVSVYLLTAGFAGKKGPRVPWLEV
jgi:hypothetical protein